MGRVTTCGDRQEVVVRVRRRACRILHGSYSWAATTLKFLIHPALPPLQREWIEIQTHEKVGGGEDKYYCIQLWFSGNIIMESATSSREVNLRGFACANKKSNSAVWTQDEIPFNLELISPICSIDGYVRADRGLSLLYLGEVMDWLHSEQFSALYNLLLHNCQHFCTAFVQHFR